MAEMTQELIIELYLVAFTVAITIVLGSQVPRVEYLKMSFSSFYLAGFSFYPDPKQIILDPGKSS